MSDTRTTDALAWLEGHGSTDVGRIDTQPHLNYSGGVVVSGSTETLPFEVGRTYEMSMPLPAWATVERWYLAPAERVRRSRREKRRARKRRQK